MGEVPPGAGDVDGEDGDDGVPPMPVPACAQAAPAADKTSAPLVARERTTRTIARSSCPTSDSTGKARAALPPQREKCALGVPLRSSPMKVRCLEVNDPSASTFPASRRFT